MMIMLGDFTCPECSEFTNFMSCQLAPRLDEKGSGFFQVHELLCREETFSNHIISDFHKISWASQKIKIMFHVFQYEGKGGGSSEFLQPYIERGKRLPL